MMMVKKLTLEETCKELKKPLRYEFIGNEKEFEEYVKANLNEICVSMGLPEVIEIHEQKQFRTESFQIIPDLIAVHTDYTVSVFEIKKPSPNHPHTHPVIQCQAIGQLLLYKSVLDEILKKDVRLFLVDNKIHVRTVCVFATMKIPITLIEIQNDRVFIPYFSGSDLYE